MMAFAFGLASFWCFEGTQNGVVEPLLDLPKVETGEVLLVLPRYGCELPFGGGGCGRLGDPTPEDIEAKCVRKFESQGITFKRLQ